MVGGLILENASGVVADDVVRRLWVMDTNGDECCVYAGEGAEHLECGEPIWWQSGQIYALNDKLALPKIGYSFRPPEL